MKGLAEASLDELFQQAIQSLDQESPLVKDESEQIQSSSLLPSIKLESGLSAKDKKKQSEVTDLAASHNKGIKTARDLVAKKPSLNERRKEKEKTIGSKWFGMKRPDHISDNVKRDLHLLKLRNVLDPKRFYKKGVDHKRAEIPKYFEIGTIVQGNAEFYSSRIPRKQVKSTFAEEILASRDSVKYLKRRFNEIQTSNQKNGRKNYKNAQKLRNKKK
ncbi:Deoxynucleotidyltransferase terminal-interacting protein 2 [Zancudomyces culisetae]|uniref:Deoxynucleotidyltransferase terminal-interacting protein 2 n=1 Tax=Zancudomyces culisetae TaxID=1213189 RepID=A0A1R1PP81_ZANCU|nr:Deoxynucleotidyltransferase terminal-interacting protein 2 [Zancudomyces culisetae]|eukprot:OMH82769.1 Deoxynucleotidyltransferase terminal-interacting protein 2 [Zancudomyces culisetae]